MLSGPSFITSDLQVNCSIQQLTAITKTIRPD